MKVQGRVKAAEVREWWRRWELNPRPKKPLAKSIHAFPEFDFVSFRALGMGKETQRTSSINLIRGVRAERVGPACSATFATGPQAKLVENGYLVN